MPDDVRPLYFCALLWARDGRVAELIAYEDRVLALLPDHGAELLQRVRSSGESGADGQPVEVQLFRFPSQASYDGYLNDERRTALAAERDHAIARTELLPVELLPTGGTAG